VLGVGLLLLPAAFCRWVVAFFGFSAGVVWGVLWGLLLVGRLLVGLVGAGII
jgi:hypothetical protein